MLHGMLNKLLNKQQQQVEPIRQHALSMMPSIFPSSTVFLMF